MMWEVLANLAVPLSTGMALGLSIAALRLARRVGRALRTQVVEEVAQEFENEGYLDHLDGPYLAELIRKHRTPPEPDHE